MNVYYICISGNLKKTDGEFRNVVNAKTYTGSYDFMLTALAKMLNIDKSLLEDSKFIAIDLI